jgi:hypothetical protein
MRTEEEWIKIVKQVEFLFVVVGRGCCPWFLLVVVRRGCCFC